MCRIVPKGRADPTAAFPEIRSLAASGNWQEREVAANALLEISKKQADAVVAELLLESLDERHDPDAEEAWARGIERRMAEYQAGHVRTIPWQELRARLHRSDR